MCRLLWEPLCLLPDAGPAPSSSRGCKNLDQPWANLWEGLDPAGTLLCPSWGHCHCKAGAHQAWRTRRRKPHRAEECWGMYVSSKHVLTISSSVLSTTRLGELYPCQIPPPQILFNFFVLKLKLLSLDRIDGWKEFLQKNNSRNANFFQGSCPVLGWLIGSVLYLPLLPNICPFLLLQYSSRRIISGQMKLWPGNSYEMWT